MVGGKGVTTKMNSTKNAKGSTISALLKLSVTTFIIIWLSVMFFVWKSSKSTALRGSEIVVSKDFNELQSLEQKASINLNHMIMVPGHAVLRFSEYSAADVSDESWYLLSYQKHQGFPQVISSHIRIGIELMKQDPASLLIFSGGETRKDVGPYSEALSYFFLAHNKGWLPEISPLNERVALEEYARDSFENLLFSLCRFKEVTGHYPSKVTVVGFDFKGQRYSHLHRKALRFPEVNFTYVGVHAPDYSSLFNQQHAEDGETIALKEFSEDLYGCNVEELKQKRKKRNPFHRSIPYELACPEMEKLLHWCGPEIIDDSLAPWVVVH
jgi:hypothetical protein